MKPQPFLGVVTQPVPPALSNQLGLDEGFGLVVEDVLPGSPAAAAGIHRHDILKRINDQHLISQDQLATLVQAAGKDVEVTLTVLRKGQEQKVTAKIAEQNRPARRLFRDGGPGGLPLLDTDTINQQVERLNGEIQEHQKRLMDVQKRSAETLDKAIAGVNRFAAELLPQDVLTENRTGGGPRVSVHSTNSSSTWNTGKARVFLKDNDGEIEVNLENGKRTMIAKDASGNVVFEGPIDTEEQRRGIPELFRKKLDQVKVSDGPSADTGSHAHDDGVGTPPPAAPAGGIR